MTREQEVVVHAAAHLLSGFMEERSTDWLDDIDDEDRERIRLAVRVAQEILEIATEE